ncbi:organic hydroperoxide resistance protein [Dactylosporangium salmoneum]|uniref:Organic hydroperoxide resistance protein n=1 Tax=Dactylosporangium salmoneum TaxID=53361 RepID=A0ABN3GD00_9ACTN
MGKLVEELYTAEVTVSGGRRGGTARSSDGVLDLVLQAPKETGGPGGATNPEQLFAAGYAACYTSALGVIARQRKLDLGPTEVTARVVLGTDESKVYGLRVEMSVRCPALDPATLREVADAAHGVCPYSRAIDGNVDVTVQVEGRAIL